ncbi:glycosyltransferase [Vreelandella titanicae]|uniref:glycosyltransferase n=1 Tax=Vreelandella titanicae TaxID=664683 RepID=UPI003CFEF02D
MDELVKYSLELAEVPAEQIEAPIANRVAYVVSHGQSYASNGYAIRTQGIAKALNENGFETLCFVRPGRPWEFDKNSKIGHEEVVDGVRYIHTKLVNKESLGGKEYLEESVNHFIKLFEIYRPSKVVAASNWIVGMPAWIAAFRLKLPFIYEVRGFWEFSKEAREPGFESTEEYRREVLNEIFVSQRARKVITLNSEMKKELEIRGIASKKIEVVPNSVVSLPKDINNTNLELKGDLRITAKDKVISYIGSFSRYEGVDLLYKACKKLVADNHSIKLLLVGNESVHEYSNDKWVVNVGRVSPDVISDYYSISDLLVIPRLTEKVTKLVTPIKLVEALSYQKNVLVSDAVPIKEYSGSITLHTFKSESVDDLIQKIKSMLEKERIEVNKDIPLYRNYINKFDVIDECIVSDLDGSADKALVSLSNYFDGIDKAIDLALGHEPVNEYDYINASKHFKEMDIPHLEVSVLNKAESLFSSSVAVLSALFWAAQRNHDFMTCNHAIRKIKNIYGKNLNSKQKELLAKLEKTPAYQLSIFNEVKVKYEVVESIKNRICYVLHNSLPYSSGGYATRADGLAQGLINQGYEIIALSRPGYPLDIKDDIDENDIPLMDTINGVNYIRTLSPQRRGLSALEYMQKSAIEIEKKLREHKPEIVIAASNHITAIPTYLAAKKLNIPFLYEVRGFWEVTRMSREPEFAHKPAYKIQVLLESMVAQGADCVFTLTQPMREELINRGVDESKITLLPNSCNPERFIPSDRNQDLAKELNIPSHVPVIGYIGTFVGYEGLDDLTNACALLKQKGYEFRLLLVGNENASGLDRGPITEEILRLAQSYNFEEWLIMPGRIPHEEVEAYYSLIDIAPFPRKPWPVCEMVSPMKPLEALAMEKAVLVSSVRALVEMVQEDKTGLVFNKGSVESLAEQLARLIDDPELRERLGKTGRKWVEEKRTWNSTGKTAADIIFELVKTR